MEQNTDEWLQMRKNYIGASDAPIIMGFSPYTTPYELWLDKLGLGYHNKETFAMWRGKELEQEARDWISYKTGKAFTPKIAFHPEISYLMASLDGVAKDGSIIEIKCNGASIHKDLKEWGVIPDHHMIQMQHQMEVTGAQSVTYVSYTPEDPIFIEIERNNNRIEQILKAEDDFWNLVTTFIPPSLTEKDKNKLAKQNMELMHDDEKWKSAVAVFLNAKFMSEMIARDLEEAKQKLIELSQDKNCCGCGITLTKVQKKGPINYDAIPELKSIDLEQYRKPSTSYWKIDTKQQM